MSIAARVPDDDFSKLQYYISCISHLLPGLDIPYELRNYQGWTVSAHGADAVIAMANLISPDVLSGKVVFPVPSNHEKLKGSSHELYGISSATSFVTAAQSVTIDGRSVGVSKVMLCQQSWLESHWASPMRSIAAQMQQPKGTQVSAATHHHVQSKPIRSRPRQKSRSMSAQARNRPQQAQAACVIM